MYRCQRVGLVELTTVLRVSARLIVKTDINLERRPVMSD